MDNPCSLPLGSSPQTLRPRARPPQSVPLWGAHGGIPWLPLVLACLAVGYAVTPAAPAQGHRGAPQAGGSDGGYGLVVRVGAVLDDVALGTQPRGLPFVHFQDFQDFLDSLHVTATIPDATERERDLDALWDALRAEGGVPYAEGDSAAFLWRGTASTVQVAGDHTRWDPSGHGLQRVGLSDVWIRVYAFPAAARIDYKLVVNGNWILDPNNPHTQLGGFGYNSELRMPAWEFPQETVRQPGTPQGALSDPLLLQSDTLGYAVRYRVYTPAGYGALMDLPALYVTDGHEYADDRLGAVRIVLDNLIAEGRVAPALVVFVDPRSPVTGANLRQQQYINNLAFAHFFAHELVPAIDAAYRTRTDRDGRVVLGTSFGGVFATYLGLLHPDVFGRLAIQSPAYWVSESVGTWTGPSLFDMMRAAPEGLFTIYLSTGTIFDGEENTRRMRDVMEARGHAVTYREVPEGHSWGNWRALIDEVALALLPAATTPNEPVAERPSALTLHAYPNPSSGLVTLAFSLAAAGPVDLACFDVAGRHVALVVAGALGVGEHARSVAFTGEGTYVCRLRAGGQTASRAITFVR